MEWTNMIVHIVFIIGVVIAGTLITIHAINAHKERKIAEARQKQYNAIADKLSPKTVITPNNVYTVDYGENGKIELK